MKLEDLFEESRVKLDRKMEGRMGRTLRPVYDIYVDGKLVGFNERKWLAKAIGDAVAAGHIPPTGDTTAAFAKWAAEHAPELYSRMPDRI